MVLSQRQNTAQRPSELTLNQIIRFKWITLGKATVGKTSLVKRFMENQFNEYCSTTIGAHFTSKTLHMNGKTIKLEIWDTAGEERFQSLVPLYYRGAHAAFVVYDIRCWISFHLAKNSVEKLRRETPENLVIFLAGNKADCTEERAVPYRDAEKYARENGLLFLETSAKLGMNVTEMFLAVVEKLLENHVERPEIEQIEHGIKLTESNVKSNPWFRKIFRC